MERIGYVLGLNIEWVPILNKLGLRQGCLFASDTGLEKNSKENLSQLINDFKKICSGDKTYHVKSKEIKINGKEKVEGQSGWGNSACIPIHVVWKCLLNRKFKKYF